MNKKIIFVKAASEILKLKEQFPHLLDDELIKLYIEKTKFKNVEEKINAIRASDFALKIKAKEKLTDKKIIQKVLDSLS